MKLQVSGPSVHSELLSSVPGLLVTSFPSTQGDPGLRPQVPSQGGQKKDKRHTISSPGARPQGDPANSSSGGPGSVDWVDFGNR